MFCRGRSIPSVSRPPVAPTWWADGVPDPSSPTHPGLSPLTLPPRVPEPGRAGFPWIASSAPVAGALLVWAVTGSSFALLFAVLGPLVAVASMMDARRQAGEEVVPFHKFAALVKDQVTKLRQSGSSEVAFRVAVKDGKVNFTVRGLKGAKD